MTEVEMRSVFILTARPPRECLIHRVPTHVRSLGVLVSRRRRRRRRRRGRRGGGGGGSVTSLHSGDR